MKPPPLNMLADEVRRRRTAAGLSRKKLSALAGLGETYISELERGLIEYPRISTVRAIAKILGCTVQDLTGEPEDAGDEFIDFRRLRWAFVIAAKQLPGFKGIAPSDLAALVELGADIYDWITREEGRSGSEFSSPDEIVDRLILIRPQQR